MRRPFTDRVLLHLHVSLLGDGLQRGQLRVAPFPHRVVVHLQHPAKHLRRPGPDEGSAGPVACSAARGPLRQRGIGAAQRSTTKSNVPLVTSRHRQRNRNKSVNFNNYDKPSLFVDISSRLHTTHRPTTCIIYTRHVRPLIIIKIRGPWNMPLLPSG